MSFPYAGTVPSNKEYAAGTVPANKKYAAGTVTANKNMRVLRGVLTYP